MKIALRLSRALGPVAIGALGGALGDGIYNL